MGRLLSLSGVAGFALCLLIGYGCQDDEHDVADAGSSNDAGVAVRGGGGRGGGVVVGTGGHLGSGGSVGTGGRIGTGGAVGTGGVAGTGGRMGGGGKKMGTGGAMGTGGVVGTGGVSGTGGAGTGGVVGTGGVTGTGGVIGTGGAGGSTVLAVCPPPASTNGNHCDNRGDLCERDGDGGQTICFCADDQTWLCPDVGSGLMSCPADPSNDNCGMRDRVCAFPSGRLCFCARDDQTWICSPP